MLGFRRKKSANSTEMPIRNKVVGGVSSDTRQRKSQSRQAVKVKKKEYKISRWRELAVLSGCLLVAMVLVGRAGILQILEKDYLQSKGDARYQRIKEQVPQRGMIVDRHDVPMAISTPVGSIWAHPKTILKNSKEYSYEQLCTCVVI